MGTCVTKDTTIMKALREHPRVREVFSRHGMGCIGCLGSEEETIESGAKMHDIDLEKLLHEINQLISAE